MFNLINATGERTKPACFRHCVFVEFNCLIRWKFYFCQLYDGARRKVDLTRTSNRYQLFIKEWACFLIRSFTVHAWNVFQIDIENEKDTASNLEKITKDYKIMKAENTGLVKKLKSCS
jgi:hypothetical protein